MKSLSSTQVLVLCATFITSVALGQGAEDRRSVVEAQSSRLSQLLRDGTQKPAVVGASVASSDVGLQQLVEERETGIAVETGVTTSYMYRSNPLSTNGELATHIKSPVVDATGFVALSLGAHDFLGGVFIPRIALSYYALEHAKTELRLADFTSTRVSLLGDLKYPNGWSVSPSIEYSNIIGSLWDTEDYREYYPNLAISKVWSLDNKSALRAVFNTGYHLSRVEELGAAIGVPIPGGTSDRLDNWTNSLGLAYSRYLFTGLQFVGFGEIASKRYSNGSNQNRSDWTRSIGSSLTYALIERKWISWRISIFGNYISRDSSNVDYKYSNLDLGASTGVSLSF